MTLKIQFKKPAPIKVETAIIYIYKDGKLSASANALNKSSGGVIKHAIKNTSKFSGEFGQIFQINTPEKTGFNTVICLGLGTKSELTLLKAEEMGGKLFSALENAQLQTAALMADGLQQKTIKSTDIAAHIAVGLKLRSYKFQKYKKPKKSYRTIKSVTFISEESTATKKLFTKAAHNIAGVFTARDLVNEPPNNLYPQSYATFIKKELTPLGVKVEILDDKNLQRLGMGGIMAVGKGSERKPRIVIMRWEGNTKKPSKSIALVGKGVTFDTGGISIKPSAGMDEMKMDMGGSAAVVGTVKAAALRKSKANIIGIVGLAENMPSHNAYRPGDIIKSYSGKTIEVLNTDAEGRLILADCLTYVQKKFKPAAIIDLATLTGAMMVALGHEYCGTFSNNDKLWTDLQDASTQSGEKLWRMPLDPEWKKQMESEVADLQNLGNIGRFAGACTAAGFLEHFIEKGTPWAHMDIAGTAWVKKNKPTVPKFGTGFGVRVLDRFIADHYE